ncbi:LLM class F420-dependent oxidoreductase [Mycolicibacterium agri]|uniref:LLM class F420-dependent oxidoreductase n=1 Tax=Mycolicibacterium agri TaxID=36811 RepID=A0A2A7NFE8_MYCAG|nr:TIGR03617 family F420-dependent LLM class oxidoreductase [Mycolicibacterium agri]PEG42832.1 LLM class F420-dependent oxidoreductase [Mycolicibacterium agri]GFG52679.1 LLM class F420-dependent oxidoreductase [Mycolicibacterium agri]
MKFDARLSSEGSSALATGSISRWAEEIGVAGLWAGENKHDAFLPLAVAAEYTSRIQLGTAVAIAFSRSPMVTAQLAWDLQRRSRGRFLLGLGTQVKPHVLRRFSMPWDRPVARLRDYVCALRAIWHSFQSGEPLNYAGRFYRHNLLPPVFNPGPLDHPHIPVAIAGVSPALISLAGEMCDGLHVHPFHTPAYIRSVVLPEVGKGAASAGRAAAEVELSTSTFVITGDSGEERERQRAAVKSRIAFYASTPAYRVVLNVHGWDAISEKLHAMSRQGRWDEMSDCVTDEMVSAFAVEADPGDVGAALRERYDGLVDRVALFEFMLPGERDDFWRELARECRDQPQEAAT